MTVSYSRPAIGSTRSHDTSRPFSSRIGSSPQAISGRTPDSFSTASAAVEATCAGSLVWAVGCPTLKGQPAGSAAAPSAAGRTESGRARTGTPRDEQGSLLSQPSGCDAGVMTHSEPPRVTVERDGSVLLIGLNRPDKRNAADIRMLEGL